MVQRREHFRFAPKPREPIVVGGERWWQDLDRDLAFQLRVRRAEHLSHPTLADLGSDLIGAEAGAWSQGQVAGSIAVEGCCGRVYSCNTPQRLPTRAGRSANHFATYRWLSCSISS